MPKRVVRVVIYGRVSTGEQNPDAQLVELRAYAERRGFAIHREGGASPFIANMSIMSPVMRRPGGDARPRSRR